MKRNLSLIERVKQTKLTPSEQHIIDTITSNITELVFYNSAKLAEICEVSASVITRLNQKLGYENFNEFKQDLEDLYRQTVTPYDTYKHYLNINSSIDASKANYSVMQDINNLIKMQKQLDQKDIDAIVEIIKKANMTYIVAMFASEPTARYLSSHLDRLKILNRCVLGVGLSKQIEFLKPQKGDIIIAISFQGIFQEIFESVSFAKRNSATVISITDSRINPLAKASDYVLVTSVDGATFDYSHVAPISMVNVLVNGIAASMDTDYLVEILDQVRQRWRELHLFISDIKSNQ
ncbi:MAG: MurR/RpiR family transcriptional regulator [Thermoanaerobacteraceae bacterium]|nr:MurR/RpiR family transcriptional regulator [Thermoanaerobacteraceae bacterium]